MYEFLSIGIIVIMAALSILALAGPKFKITFEKSKTLSKITDSPSFGIYKMLTLVVLSRIFLLLMCYIVMTIQHDEGNVLSLLRENGDVPHYEYLAEHWYTNQGDKQNLIVFYPLFPICMRIVKTVLFLDSYYIAGAIVSNVAALGACYYLYKLVRIDYDQRVADDAVLFMLIYPFSFFMLFAYTESLFVFMCLACGYYARKAKWVRCGILGMLAALCRTQGVMMIGFAIYELIVQAANPPEREEKKGFIRSLSPRALALLLIPAGFGMYLSLNKYYFGDYFKFMEFQSAPPWYQDAGFFGDNLAQHYNMGVEYGGLGYIIYFAQLIIFFMTFIFIAIGIKKHVRTSYLLHASVYTVVSYASTWLISGPRYMASNVFIWIPIAVAAKNKTFRVVMILLYGTMFFYYFIAYLYKHAIM